MQRAIRNKYSQPVSTSKPNHTQAGMILPTILLIMLLLTFIGLTLSTVAITQLRSTSRAVSATNSLLVAESGVEKSLHELNDNNSFSGYGSEQELFNNQKQGRGTYETTVENGTISNEKIITAIGRVYTPADAAEPTVIRRVRVVAVGTSSSSGYAVRGGAGGLVMTGAATIANGPVYVNGGIRMEGAARIGSLATPVSVNAANVRCPDSAMASYPQLCDPGGDDPIEAGTIVNRIYGDVCATHQQEGDFMSNAGLQAGCVAPELPLPDYDRQAQINAVSTTYTSSQAGCSGVQNKIWPANLHVTGNVIMKGSCRITIKGDVWINGKFEVGGASRISIDNSITETPTIMVDGSSGVTLGGSTQIIPNNAGIAALVITYYSQASCSPNCADVTGVNLFNSKDRETVVIEGAAQAPGSLFYARWSKIVVKGASSTGGTIGQTVELHGAGNIVFGTELSSGTSVWAIKNYQLIFE